MADQNQNTIPGTLRTLKTDLSMTPPQERLQQAGNFMQARPMPDEVNQEQSVSGNDINQPASVTLNTPSQQSAPQYSWSNMDNNKKDVPFQTGSGTNATNIDTNTGLKSGFSVLEDADDFALDSSFSPSSITEEVDMNTMNDKASPVNQNFSMNNANISSGENNNVDIYQSNPTKKAKSPIKALLSGFIALVLVGLIGGGVYLYFTRFTNVPTNTNEDTTQEPLNPVEPSEPPVQVADENTLFEANIKLDIAFVDTEPIRKTVLTVLSSKTEELIELNLTSEGNKIPFTDMADALGLVIPSNIQTDIKAYWLYAYNQQGVYKLIATFVFEDFKLGKDLIDSWSTSIPRDLSGFSLNVPSRIVNSPDIKTATVTSASGKVYNNYYYNYTSPNDSVDVSSVDNYILIASSQDSMKFILDQLE